MPGMFDIGTTAGTVAAGERSADALLTTAGGLITRTAAGVVQQLAPGSQGKVPAVQSDGSLAYEHRALAVFSDWQSGSVAVNNSLNSILTATYSIPAGSLAVGDLLIVEHAGQFVNASGGAVAMTFQVSPFAASFTYTQTISNATTRPFVVRAIVRVCALSSAAQMCGITATFGPDAGGPVANVGNIEVSAVTATWDASAAQTFDFKIKGGGASGQTYTNAMTTLVHVPKGVLAA